MQKEGTETASPKGESVKEFSATLISTEVESTASSVESGLALWLASTGGMFSCDSRGKKKATYKKRDHWRMRAQKEEPRALTCSPTSGSSMGTSPAWTYPKQPRTRCIWVSELSLCHTEPRKLIPTSPAQTFDYRIVTEENSVWCQSLNFGVGTYAAIGSQESIALFGVLFLWFPNHPRNSMEECVKRNIDLWL